MRYVQNGDQVVGTGSFSAKIVTLAGATSAVPMTFNSATQSWGCQIVMGQLSGVAYVDVVGSSSGVSGEAIWEFFAGYLATFYYPYPTLPWTTSGDGLPVVVVSTDLDGNLAPSNQSLSMRVNSYQPLRNRFINVDVVSLPAANDSQLGQVFTVDFDVCLSCGSFDVNFAGQHLWVFAVYEWHLSPINRYVS